MANYCGAPYLAPAIRSVLGQSHGKLELLVVDDASTDNSVEIIRAEAAADARVRLLALPQNGGPAKARNAALEAARGEWIAVVDADDLLNGLQLQGPAIITPELLITQRAAHGASVQLGYLKPLLRRELIRTRRYNEQLRIGEDYDLLLRLVLDGARLCVTPQSFYHYRRHSASISHRLSEGTARAMLASHDDLARAFGGASPGILAAFAQRRRTLREQLDYELLVAAIKQRRLGTAAAMLRHPSLLRRLARSLRERLARKAHSRPPVTAELPS
ncbi:MAG: hypothetical protein K0R85_2596 [Devosia sp.]|nr:hypothetical protein [Devosia sp.]